MRAGAWVLELAPGVSAAPFERMLEAFACGRQPAGATLVKRGRTREVFRLELAGVGAGAAPGAGFAKRYPGNGRSELFRATSRARREYANLARVRARGLPAVEPLAWAERREGGRLCEAVLLTREGAGARPLAAALAEAGAAELAARLGTLARALHDAGFWHRDLHVGNALAGAGGEVVLIDLQKLRVLPRPLPRVLRVWDLAALQRSLAGPALCRRALEAYARGGVPELGLPELVRRVERAALRGERTHLRSRGRRCVRPSTGFRIERSGGRSGRQVVYRRADIEPDAVFAAIAAHGERVGRALAPAAAGDALISRVEDVLGGPPQGPVARPADRGEGRPEAGAPARGPVRVAEFRGGSPALLRGRHPGMAAWRDAHARLLRGQGIPAPLALVEQRRFGLVRRAYLLTRWE